MVRQLPNYVDRELVDKFQEVDCHNPADFCLKMYGKMGLLDGVRVERSSSPEFRKRAVSVDNFILLMPSGKAKRFGPAAGTENCFCTRAPTGSSNSLPRISTPLRSVLRVILVCGGCNRSFNASHYVAGAGEQEDLNEADAPGITFVPEMRYYRIRQGIY